MATRKKTNKRANTKTKSKKINFNNDNMHKHVLFGFQTILVIAVALVVILGFFYAGFYVGYQMGVNKGWENAGQAIAEAGIFPDEDIPVYRLVGTVTKVDAEGRKIYFNADQPSRNPLAPQAPTERMAVLGENAVVIKIIEKSEDQLEQERLAYAQAREEALAAGLEPPPTPSRVVETVYTLEALKGEERVAITSENDVRFAESFEADSIRIY